MSHHRVRDNTTPFTEEYLKSANKDVISNILWPVPVLQQETTKELTLDHGSISPGDGLEVVDGSREEYLLVTTVTDTESNPKAVCYSTNRETFVQLYESELHSLRGTPMELNVNREDNLLVENLNTIFAVHESIVDPVADDPIGSISWITDSPIEEDLDNPPRPAAYYPYSSPPTPLSVHYPRTPYRSNNDISPYDSTDEITNTLIHGDALTELQKMPDDSVHTWVTSPPYPGSQREYDIDSLLGAEQSPDRYLENLLPIIIEAMETLRDDGTGWLIIDDTISKKEYAGVPDRLIGLLKSEGYNIIHNGPWTKQDGNSGMPDPAPNRFAHNHERVIGISNTPDYYFARYAVGDQTDIFTHPASSESRHNPPKDPDTKHDAKYSVELVNHILDVATPEKVCPQCGTPYTPQYEVTDILNLKSNKADLVRSNFEESDLTREHLRACRSYGISDTGQASRTQSGSGKNSDRVERLVSEVREDENFSNSYIRELGSARKEHTGNEKQCNCTIDSNTNNNTGIVLDPFIGAGTTAVAATKQQKQYIGVDLNEDYIDKARKWINRGCQSGISDW